MATQKMINQKASMDPKQWTDNLHSIAESQNKVAEAAKTLVGRLERRQLTDQDQMIKELTENVNKAVEKMGPICGKPDEEQRHGGASLLKVEAYNYLGRAAALYTEIQVSQGRGGGGGGGGGQQSAEDLADLFELELDQNKNQYETVQRGEGQQQSQQEQQVADKLEELAKRQQAEIAAAAEATQQNPAEQPAEYPATAPRSGRDGAPAGTDGEPAE